MNSRQSIQEKMSVQVRPRQRQSETLQAQMIAAGELRDLKAARACIAESFEMNMFRSGQERRFI